MALALQNLQTQITRHRGKSTVLLVLAVALVCLMVKSIASSGPRAASALPTSAALAAVAPPSPVVAALPADLDPRARQSKVLWDILRETRGLPNDQAFTFDPSYYTLNPAHRHEHEAAAASRTEPTSEKISSDNTMQAAAGAHVSAPQEQATKLQLQSIVMGPRAVAVINSRVVRVGDHVAEYRVVSIQPRFVLLNKDGQSLALKMAE